MPVVGQVHVAILQIGLFVGVLLRRKSRQALAEEEVEGRVRKGRGTKVGVSESKKEREREKEIKKKETQPRSTRTGIRRCGAGQSWLRRRRRGGQTWSR